MKGMMKKKEMKKMPKDKDKAKDSKMKAQETKDSFKKGKKK